MRIGFLCNTEQYPDGHLDQLFPDDELLHWWPACKQDWDESTLAEHCRSVDVVVIHRAFSMLPACLADDLGQLKLAAHGAGSVRGQITADLIEGDPGDELGR